MKEELEEVNNRGKYPLILGVDEEGGFVTRISRFPEFRNEKFKAPKDYYLEGGYDLVEQIEIEKAKLLKSLGLNLNLAPVADVSTNENDFIYSRAFGKGASETSEYISKMVTYANNNKINSCLKHFPGYGNNVDTHTGIAIDERPYESFKENDFVPFEAGIKAGVPSVLIAHNVVKSMDPNYPASLSEKVIAELRTTLNFTGIIMTDDLAMDAVKAYVEDGKAATLAINAGNDMIITSDFMTMYKEILKSIEDKDISMDTINKAVIRIIAWKYYSGIM
jgi:beta-N-acetylhexosaminidase